MAGFHRSYLWLATIITRYIFFALKLKGWLVWKKFGRTSLPLAEIVPQRSLFDIKDALLLAVDDVIQKSLNRNACGYFNSYYANKLVVLGCASQLREMFANPSARFRIGKEKSKCRIS